ncbi:hypothetical protein [Rheinheimera sp.]|uniref:hypothetical protein n=1 Tax=Rheinheimera sp. TaxID=1869214 RepID=UPI00404770B4
MTQLNNNTNTADRLAKKPTLTTDLALTTFAVVVFMQAATYSSGWFLPVASYMLAVAALFATINRHSTSPVSKLWLTAINALGCTGLIAALWFSGKMAVLF